MKPQPLFPYPITEEVLKTLDKHKCYKVVDENNVEYSDAPELLLAYITAEMIFKNIQGHSDSVAMNIIEQGLDGYLSANIPKGSRLYLSAEAQKDWEELLEDGWLNEQFAMNNPNNLSSPKWMMEMIQKCVDVPKGEGKDEKALRLISALIRDYQFDKNYTAESLISDISDSIKGLALPPSHTDKVVSEDSFTMENLAAIIGVPDYVSDNRIWETVIDSEEVLKRLNEFCSVNKFGSKQAEIVKQRLQYHFGKIGGGWNLVGLPPFMKEFLNEVDKLCSLPISHSAKETEGSGEKNSIGIECTCGHTKGVFCDNSCK